MSGGDDGGPLRAFAEAERLVYQPAEELGRGGRLHGVHGVCRGVEVDAGPFVRAGSRYLDRHGTPPPLEVRVRGRAIHPTEDTLCLWPNGVLTRLARLLGAPSWVSGDARFDAAYLVETTSGAAASVAPPSAIDAPTPAAAAAVERPASPFAATLEKAVARAEQRTELIDVRKRSKKRRSSIVLEVVLFVLALLVGWLAAWWLVG